MKNRDHLDHSSVKLGRNTQETPKDKKTHDDAYALHPRDDIDRLYVSKKEEEDSPARINRTTITRKHEWKEKQLDGHFLRKTSEISHEKTWMWLTRGNLKRETESLLIAAQNNAMLFTEIPSDLLIHSKLTHK